MSKPPFVRTMQRGFFAFRNLKLLYLESGSEHKPKLLIAHANGYAAGCYTYLIDALSSRYHVCALDFAGHGESQGTLDFNSWNFFRDQILALIEHKGWQSCTAIGHSLGGGSLLRAAQVDAGRFEKIIAFDPVMLSFLLITYVKLFGNPMAKVALTRRADFKSKAQALKIFERHPAQKSWERDSVAAYVEYCIAENEHGARLRCDPKIEAQIFSQTEYAHLFRLGRINCETHIVLPERSNVCPRWVAKKVAAAHVRSSVIYLPGTAHLLPFENRMQTLALIEARL